jgi:hypothetical protein
MTILLAGESGLVPAARLSRQVTERGRAEL